MHYILLSYFITVLLYFTQYYYTKYIHSVEN